MSDRLKALAESWDANAANWTRAVREGQIASRKAGTDAAMLEAVATRRPRGLLDAGCGEGWLVRAARQARGCAATGIDASAALIAAARSADPGGDYQVLGYDALVAGCHDLPPAGFDVIAFNYALFDSDPGVTALLAATRRLLAPGGAVIIQTLHPGSLAPDRRAGWQTEDFTAFEQGDAPWAAMPWYARSRAGWQSVIGHAGLSVTDEREPAAAAGTAPLSLLLICETAGVSKG